MAKSSPSDSDPEEVETTENSSSDDDDEDCCNGQKQQQGISEYEKQRLSRIAENKARMEALGLPKIASSFMASAQKSSERKGKRKVVVHADEDYRPIDDDDDDDDDDDEDFDDDEEFLVNEGSRSRKKKVNKKSPKPKKKKGPVQRQLSSSDYIDGDDDDLMQAIALSLKDSAEASGGVCNKKGNNARAQEDTGRRKRKKSFTSRVKMTEDEVVLHFFQFDEAGTESISIRDLRRVAIAHDFMWTDEELANMIHCFDSDGDGKISLNDFRKIVGRCNMIQVSENS